MLTILHPLDLRIDSGRVVAITGPSGSGKSTLFGLLAGLDSPSSGQILIDDVDITALAEDALAKLRGTRIGFVFQFFHLLPSLTACENVLVPMEIAGAPDAGAARDALLAEVGLADRGASLSVAALRRRTAARGYRPRAGQQSADPARRRADGQSRIATGQSGHRSADRRESHAGARRSSWSRMTPSSRRSPR